MARRRRGGQRVVFTNGCFDILHIGHARCLDEAASLGDLLIVGVNDDTSVSALKGPNRPAVPGSQRAEMVAALGGVDYVVIFGGDTLLDLLRAVKPDVLVKGGDYAPHAVIGAELIESYGGRVCVTSHTAGISTTHLAEALSNSTRPGRSDEQPEEMDLSRRQRPHNAPTVKCRYLGTQTGTRDCMSCQGRVQQKVFACSHPDHADTTLADCKICPDRIMADAPEQRAAMEIPDAADVQPGIVAIAELELASEAKDAEPDQQSDSGKRELAAVAVHAGPLQEANGHALSPTTPPAPRTARFTERLNGTAGLTKIGPQAYPRVGTSPQTSRRAAAKASKLILKSFMCPGDTVMLTAAVRDLHLAYPGEFQTDVRTSVPALWENNPRLTALNEGGPGVVSIDMHYDLVNQSNTAPYHFVHGYVRHLEQRLGLRIPVTQFHGDIHLAPVEKQWMSQVEELGFHGNFWIVIVPSAGRPQNFPEFSQPGEDRGLAAVGVRRKAE